MLQWNPMYIPCTTSQELEESAKCFSRKLPRIYLLMLCIGKCASATHSLTSFVLRTWCGSRSICISAKLQQQHLGCWMSDTASCEVLHSCRMYQCPARCTDIYIVTLTHV